MVEPDRTQAARRRARPIVTVGQSLLIGLLASPGGVGYLLALLMSGVAVGLMTMLVSIVVPLWWGHRLAKCVLSWGELVVCCVALGLGAGASVVILGSAQQGEFSGLIKVVAERLSIWAGFGYCLIALANSVPTLRACGKELN